MSHQPHGAAAEELQEWIIADDEEGSESAKESAAVPPRPPPLLIAEGLVPYWLNLPQKKINSKSDNASNRGNSGGSGSGVGNDVSLSAGELVLLTAPNMSGKSTLMQSLLSASLLANCGLRVPAHHFQAPRFDAFFLRAAGGDSPAEVMILFAFFSVFLSFYTSHFVSVSVFYYGISFNSSFIHEHLLLPCVSTLLSLLFFSLSGQVCLGP